MNILSDDDIALLAAYGVDADDPAAADLVKAVRRQVCEFKRAFRTCGPDQFFRHMAMSVSKMHCELELVRGNLKLVLDFHAPADTDTIH